MVTVALAVSLAGCAAPKTVQVTAKPSPSSSAVFTSNAEALAAAKAVYDKYVQVDDQVSDAGGKDASKYSRFLAKDALANAQESVAYVRKQHLHTTGSTLVPAFRLQQADLATGKMTAYVCSDVSEVRILNVKDEDVTPEGGESRQTFLVTFERLDDTLHIVKSTVWSGASIC